MGVPAGVEEGEDEGEGEGDGDGEVVLFELLEFAEHPTIELSKKTRNKLGAMIWNSMGDRVFLFLIVSLRFIMKTALNLFSFYCSLLVK